MKKLPKAAASFLADGIPVHVPGATMVPIEDLVPSPDNEQDHPDRQLVMIAKSIEGHGWRQAIIVSGTSGFIVAGHGRLAAAKLAGWKEVPVVVQRFSSAAEETAYRMADNEITKQSLRNLEKTKESLAALEKDDFNLQLAGFDAMMLADLEALSLDEYDFETPQGGYKGNAKKEKDMTTCPHCGGAL